MKERRKKMATSTIRLDDGVREETTRIASQMGLSFNAVMNIMARKFNEVKGFPFPVCPYAKMHTLYPSKTEVANGTVSSKISAVKKVNENLSK
jgi:antitoxin component of RelBE/YafQ-DinJ toxin-antitoxin module